MLRYDEYCIASFDNPQELGKIPFSEVRRGKDLTSVNYLLLFVGQSEKGGHEAQVRSFSELAAARQAMIEAYQRLISTLNIPAGSNRDTTMTENRIRLERHGDAFQWEIIKAVPEDNGTDDASVSCCQNNLKQYTVSIEEHIIQEFPLEACDIFHALQTAETAYKQGTFVVQPSTPSARLMMARDNGTGEMTEWKEF